MGVLSKPSKYSLLDLPAELRLKIYEYALASFIMLESDRSIPVAPNNFNITFARGDRPRFMFSSKIMQQEIEPILWGRVHLTEVVSRHRDMSRKNSILVNSSQLSRIGTCYVEMETMCSTYLGTLLQNYPNLKELDFGVFDILDTHLTDDWEKVVELSQPCTLKSLIEQHLKAQSNSKANQNQFAGHMARQDSNRVVTIHLALPEMTCFRRISLPNDKAEWREYCGPVYLAYRLTDGNIKISTDELYAFSHKCRQSSNSAGTSQPYQSTLSQYNDIYPDEDWDDFETDQLAFVLVLKELQKQGLLDRISPEPCHHMENTCPICVDGEDEDESGQDAEAIPDADEVAQTQIENESIQNGA